MDLVSVSLKNHVYLKVSAEPHVLQEISEYFTFDVPGARFTPAYKFKTWDGKIRLFSVWTKELYAGLNHKLEEFCSERNYEFENLVPSTGNDVNEDEAQIFMRELKLYAHDENIEPRDYQIDAFVQAVKDGRLLLLSPTASGKSVVIYALVRWHQKHQRKQLIIVPTTALVEQMYEDFREYSSQNGWEVDKQCIRIYSGKEKDFDLPVVISTWQSIFKYSKEFFEQFDVIYGDEAHLFKAKSLTKIFQSTINAPFKIGTSGTLDGTKCHELVLEGLFGPIRKITTTKKLMDEKHLADLTIKCLNLIYSDEEKKAAAKKGFDYVAEINFLVSHARRNAFIVNLATTQKGNTLLLFQYIEKHGKPLYETIVDVVKDGRKVFFVHGKVDAAEREMVRKITEQETDAIIVASTGVFSQGTNIRNLHNIILASPSKSRIRNLQSIGRGLRTSDVKKTCTLFDIGDDLSWKSRRNHTLLHLIERVRIYAEEGFRYSIVPVKLF
jgi:superfamily II DNA or RNA helicase